MATGEVIVKKALDQLKSTITTEDVRMFSDTSLEDLWREARKVEQEQGTRMDLRFMRRLEPFLRSLESYASVIEVFCQGYAPMAFVWGPVKLMLLLAKNYSSVMDKILQAFSDIADVLPRLDRLKATFPKDANFNQIVGLIYSDIIEFHQRVYKFFRRKAWHIWFAFDWGLFERRFKLILQKLMLHCELLDKEAAAAHFFEMKQFRDRRQLEEDAFERDRQHRMVQEVIGWLSGAVDEQEDRLHLISDKRQPETCNWVLKDPQMRPWIEEDGGEAVLWMTGIPGAGKSILCSLLVENLQTQQHLSTLYFFCGHQSPSGDTCATILRTLVIQLVQQNLDIASLVHQAFLQKGSNRSSPTMRKMLTQILPSSKVARIVVDGIDEYAHATQQEVLKSLVDIQKSSNHCCKVLVSSRDEPQIQKSLAAKIHLKLGEKTVEGLDLYIKERMKQFTQIDPALVNLAEQRLHSKAKGMFLWVRLVTDMLTHQTSEFEFENAIDQLPEGLDEAYGIIQSRIACRPIQLRQRAFNILYWVCVARRPISLHEVADGIVLHPGQTTLNKRTRMNNTSRDIIEICAPLLERLNNGVLELVHFSAKEYFVHEQSGPFIEVAKAHLNIALSCIINLTSCLDLVPQKTNGMTEADLESRVVQGCYGLHSYGQEFWAEHTLAYLGELESRDGDARKLISALENFSQVWKHRAHAETSLLSTLRTAEASSGLNSLREFPTLHMFVTGWLYFKSQFSKMKPTFESLDAQEQWRLGTDETFLSLIETRLCIITERLLKMQPSQLPSHIDENDFRNFVSRFNFSCRFQGCNHQYGAVQERDAHETSHVLFFPCFQCDFSGRGFRSRKDLERHAQKDHMSPEDFEIPDDLHTLGENLRGSNLSPEGFRVPSNRPGLWTERGRRALQQGFGNVLAVLEPELEAATEDAGKPDSREITSAKAAGPRLSQHINERTGILTLDSVRRNVKEQKYENLADFKNDLNVLCGDSTMASELLRDGRIESICDDALEKAMSAFPAFANFDHTVSKRGTVAGLLSNRTEQLQGQMESLTKQENDMASPYPIPLGTRVPYWSLPEQEQFPELLRRCGRDFLKIANHLKTKTPEEVDQHFVHLLSMGNNELADLADLADARLQREACTIGITMGTREIESDIQAPNGIARQKSDLLQLSQPSSVGPYLPQVENPRKSQPWIQGPAEPETNVESGKSINEPQSRKRRPRLRAPCPHCSSYKDGLSDEYALKRHIERFHTATRRVWVCEDVSIDKKFLIKCKACTASKRYSSENNASKHLRIVHFNAKTSAQTLQRWMREIEEPNPNMQTPTESSTLSTAPPKKRQKTRGMTISLPPLKGPLDHPRTLPSMVLETKVQRHSDTVSSPESSSGLHDDPDEDNDANTRGASLSSPEAESFKNDVFLEDISFENLLPGNANEQSSLNNDGPPHRTNRALIKPDQVPRLPNLNSFRKAACLDQVEALYHKLDNTHMDSSGYKEALENLTSLSRLLMSNLRDWRQHSTLAPNIPFSI